jgi:hypothetical protein
MYVDFNILNQLGSPAFNSNTLAKRPAAGYKGRLFVSTDTFALYRDNGTGWDLIGGPGTGTVTGAGVATRVAFWDGTSSISSNANLYWDNTNSRLGIGTNTPGTKLDIHGAGTIAHLNGTGTNSSYLAFQQAGTSQYSTGYDYNAGTRQNFRIYDNVGAKNVLGILQSSRFVGINYQFTGASDVPRYTFDVFGNIGATGTFDFGNNTITQLTSTGTKISSKYLGNQIGLNFDFSTNDFLIGNTSTENFIELATSLSLLNGRVVEIGDTIESTNSTQFYIDDNNQKIYTRNQGNDKGINLNFDENTYHFGDFQGISSNTYISIDADQGNISINANGSNLYGDSDVTRIGNTYNFGTDDANQTLTASANLLSGTAGGASGQYLKIKINGVNYKIELRNA